MAHQGDPWSQGESAADEEERIEEALRFEEEEARLREADQQAAHLAALGYESEGGECPSFCVSSPGLLVQQMAAARAAGDLCDIDLHVGGKVFHAHKFPLMMGSPVLRTRLTSLVGCSSSEAPAAGASVVVKLEGIEAHIFERVLGFLYAGQVQLDAETVLPTLFAADLLQVRSVEESAGRGDVATWCWRGARRTEGLLT